MLMLKTMIKMRKLLSMQMTTLLLQQTKTLSLCKLKYKMKLILLPTGSKEIT